VTYPDGRAVAYHYTGDAVSGKLSRVSSIGDLQNPYARFTYLGADMIVEVDHPAVTGGLKLSYGADGAAGLDGLGRVVDQKWTTGEGETLAVVDRFGYTYDLAGNRLTRDVGAAPFEQDLFDEKYTYDALNRLTNVERGRLYCGDITASTLTQDWTLDAVGNWDGFAWDPDGDGSAEEVAQTREHDAANQLTGFTTGPTWVTPAYDAAGNMTLAPKPGDEYHGLALTYDAWNRLVRVSGGATPVAEYQYDGLNRRTAKLVFDAPSDTWTRTDSYLNEAWQVLEERVATAVLAADKGQVATDASVQYLWDPRYIDMPILRWRNANVEDPDLEETLYYTTDANFNVTALIDGSTGDPTERYIYDAYGTVTVLNPDWSPKTVNTSAFGNEILFTGHPLDGETGLYYARARYLQPTLGVWVNPDPSGYADGMNLYQYCSGNPTARTDPSGLFWQISDDSHLWWVDDSWPAEGSGMIDYGQLVKKNNLTDQQLNAVYQRTRAYFASGQQHLNYTVDPTDGLMINLALLAGHSPKEVLGRRRVVVDERSGTLRFYNDVCDINMMRLRTDLDYARALAPADCSSLPTGQETNLSLGDVERVMARTQAMWATAAGSFLRNSPILTDTLVQAGPLLVYAGIALGGKMPGGTRTGATGNAETQAQRLGADLDRTLAQAPSASCRPNASINAVSVRPTTRLGGTVPHIEGNIPNAERWILRGGRITWHPDGSFTYADWEGNAVRYSNLGYPDFSAAGLVRQEVQFIYKGNYTTDFANADALAPLGSRLPASTWHHVEDLARMQEINRRLHMRFTHTGGVSLLGPEW